jgi:hypothetical protein
MLSWRNILDAWQLHGIKDIYQVNSFTWEHTSYNFFAFNGIVFKTMNPKKFDYKESDTGLKVETDVQ